MADIEYMFPSGNDTLKRLQSIEFEMALAIKKIFDKNQIRYVLGYGSLLGAVRHGGFIPWDDDFDYVVFEDDYEKASAALRSELPSKYILHDKESDPNYYYTFSKVRHLSSIAYEGDITDTMKYNGICIDLFKGKVEKNNQFARRLFLAKNHIKSHWIKFRQTKSLVELIKILIYWIKKLWFLGLHTITPNTEYFHQYPEVNQFFFPLDKYLPISSVTFNGIEFPAPHDPKYILKSIYGNWMQVPKNITYHIKKLEIFDD